MGMDSGDVFSAEVSSLRPNTVSWIHVARSYPEIDTERMILSEIARTNGAYLVIFVEVYNAQRLV